MTLAELHQEETARARDRFDHEVTELKRLLWLQTLASLVLAIVIVGHAFAVVAVNRAKSELEQVMSAADHGLSLVAFLGTHVQERAYTVEPDPLSVAAQRLLGRIARVTGQSLTIENSGGVPMRTLLTQARERPDGIRFSAPYLGEVEIPIGHAWAAFWSALAILIGNVFVLVRRRAMDDLLDYVAHHQGAAVSSAKSGGVRELRFRPNPSFLIMAWPRLTRSSFPRATLELLTGIAHRDAGDSASLIEWGGGILAALIACMMFCTAIFLAVEPVFGNGLATAVGLAGGSVLTLVSPMLLASLIRRAQRLQ